MDATEIAYMSASDLALKIRRRELSPVEVLEATIARIERRNPSLNALIYLDFEGAKRAARNAEDTVTLRAAAFKKLSLNHWGNP